MEIINVLNNPNVLNIIGLVFDIIGALIISFYVIKGKVVGLQTHGRLIVKLFGSFEKLETKLTMFGFILLAIGFAIQVYANIIQL